MGPSAARVACAIVAVACAMLAGPWTARAGGIQTGIYLHGNGQTMEDSEVAGRVAALGANLVRISVSWAAIAPTTLPASWDPTDPADPNYSWSALDAEIEAVVAHGLQPVLTVFIAPSWAQQGKPAVNPASYLPDAAAFGSFAEALAKRYSGSFRGLPRVRYFQAWDEPNLSLYLVPQLVKGVPVGANDYRSMLNAFAQAVHGVHADNVVVAGGLAPFRDVTADVISQDSDWGPLSFMRAVLCLSPSLKPTCHQATHADAWALHPYTSGNATHQAVLANDVSLGDLPKVRRALDAALAAHTLAPSRPLQLWVTEFSWDSDPPDPKAVPIALLRRWVPEAVYQMWRNGVTVAIWYQLVDDPLATSFYQSGLYSLGSGASIGRAKPYLEGWRFPFVAYRHGGSISVWARLPGSRRGSIRVQQQSGAVWTKLGALRSDSAGIVQGVVRNRTSGPLRARIVGSGETSLPFSLVAPPDHFYNPFGLPTLLEPRKKR